MDVRGIAPSMAGGPCRPRLASKIVAPNRVPLGFQNELRKCVRTSHVGGSFFYWERRGDRSIGGANLRKGAALQCPARPVPVRGCAPSMAGVPCTRGVNPLMEAALPPPSMAVRLAPILAPLSTAHPAPAGVGCGGIRGWRRTSKRSFGGKRASAPKIIRGLSYLRLDS